MTRRGAHKGGFHWGGGGPNIGQRRFDEIMGQLLVGRLDLQQIESQLSKLYSTGDYVSLKSAMELVEQILQMAKVNGRSATKMELIRARHLSQKLITKGLYLQSRLRIMLRKAPPEKSATPMQLPRLGRPSVRELAVQKPKVDK